MRYHVLRLKMMGEHQFIEDLEGLQTIHAPLNHYMLYLISCKAMTDSGVPSSYMLGQTNTCSEENWLGRLWSSIGWVSVTCNQTYLHICPIARIAVMAVVLWISTCALLEHNLSPFKNLTHNLGVGKSTSQQVPFFWHISPAKTGT